VLNQFAKLARQQNDAVTADRLVIEAGRLRGHIEHNAWDGEWYRRAYFDDGTPLGSSENEECQIDSISQSWPAYTIHYRFHDTTCHITVKNGGEGSSICRLTIDTADQPEHFVPLINDHTDHAVEIPLE
jgi:cellobiose phosphorylase